MKTNTISQALRKINKLKGAVSTWQQRARQANVVMQQRTQIDVQAYKHLERAIQPIYTFATCLEALTTNQAELIELESRVALTNAMTYVEYDGKRVTLTWAIKKLAELKGMISFYQHLSTLGEKEISDTEKENGRLDKEAREYETYLVTTFSTCTVTTAEKDKKLEELQNDFDALNRRVEWMNHETELMPLGAEAAE